MNQSPRVYLGPAYGNSSGKSQAWQFGGKIISVVANSPRPILGARVDSLRTHVLPQTRMGDPSVGSLKGSPYICGIGVLTVVMLVVMAFALKVRGKISARGREGSLPQFLSGLACLRQLERGKLGN